MPRYTCEYTAITTSTDTDRTMEVTARDEEGAVLQLARYEPDLDENQTITVFRKGSHVPTFFLIDPDTMLPVEQEDL